MSATDKAIPLNPECCLPEIADLVFESLTVRFCLLRRASLELKEVWQYRELLYFLIWRDIKLRQQANCAGRDLGNHPATAAHADFHAIFWTARASAFKRNCVLAFRLRRSASVDKIFQRRLQQFVERGWQMQTW